jgi:hypothetical protein
LAAAALVPSSEAAELVPSLEAAELQEAASQLAQRIEPWSELRDPALLRRAQPPGAVLQQRAVPVPRPPEQHVLSNTGSIH